MTIAMLEAGLLPSAAVGVAAHSAGTHAAWGAEGSLLLNTAH